MATPVKLAAAIRQHAPHVIRRDGAIPAVVYGPGVASRSVQVDERTFLKVLSQAGETSLVTLTVDDGQEHTVLVREIQHHPITNTIMHVDFYQVRLDEVIEADVPLKFVGESSAIKDLGGVLVHPLDEISLKALPQDLPREIEVNLSALDSFEKVIHVSDLQVPPGVTLLHKPDDVVALIQEPKTQAELDAELAAEVKEDVEKVEGVAEKKVEEAVEPAADGKPETEPKKETEKKKKAE